MPLPTARPMATSQAVKGQLPPTATARRHVVRIPRSPNFLYKFHPLRWMCIIGDDGAVEFLPQLGKLKLDGGVGGCDYDPIQGFNIMQARENARQNGWVILSPEAVGFEYVRMYDVPRGKAFLPMWSRVIPQPGKRPARVLSDDEAYRDFLRDLIDREVIPPISEGEAQQMMENLRERIDRRSGDRADSPALERRLANEEKILGGMTTALGGTPETADA